MEKITLSLAQIDAEPEQIKDNTARMVKAAKDIKAQYPEVQLIAFPELALTGYECKTNFAKIARDPSINIGINTMQKTAKQLNVHLAFGYAELTSDGVYNSLMLINDQGQSIGNYRKVHLPPHEANIFIKGDRYCLCKTSFGNIGLQICWDAAFPEPARLYAESGADLLLVVSAWEQPYAEQWILSVRSRSFDNGLPVAAVNRVGTDLKLEFCGNSLITDAMGNILAQAATDHEEYLILDLDQKLLKQQKQLFSTQMKELQKHTYSQHCLDICP